MDPVQPEASVVQTGLGIRYVQDWAYAYSGVVQANGADKTALDFISGTGLIVGKCYPTVNADQMGSLIFVCSNKLMVKQLSSIRTKGSRCANRNPLLI